MRAADRAHWRLVRSHLIFIDRPTSIRVDHYRYGIENIEANGIRNSSNRALKYRQPDNELAAEALSGWETVLGAKWISGADP